MDNKISLTAIIIARNSEELIEECINSVSFCSEIIVVDGVSSDKTLEIATRLGVKIVKGSEKSFAEQRNIGLKHARNDWVFYIDTDERVSKELELSIQSKVSKPQDKNIVAFKVKRKNYYLGNYCWPKIELLERLFKKTNLKEWKGDLHESPIYSGNIGVVEGFLYHYTHRNLSSMVNKTNAWSEVEAKLRLKNNHPIIVWWRFLRVMTTAFFDSYIKQGGIRIGTPGLIESTYQAFSVFITYAKLWEMRDRQNQKT